MQSMRISLLAGALLILAEPMAAHAQTAQTSCSQGQGGLVCTISGGPSSSPLAQTSGALSLTNDSQFDISSSSSAYVLNTVAQGVAGADVSSGHAGRGGDAGYNSTTNSAAITLTGDGAQTGFVSGLLVQALGGVGGNVTEPGGSGTGGDGGNSAGGVWAGNYAQVQLNGSFSSGVAAIFAQGQGGSGGYNQGDGGGGGGGGWGGSVQIENYAPVVVGTAQAPATGSGSAYGLLALSQGGSGGNGNPVMGPGGPGQYASVLSTQPVSVYWTWVGSGPESGDQVFGVLAKSAGGNAVQTSITAPGTSANYGGNTGQVSVTINQGSTVTVAAGDVPAPTRTGLVPSLTGAGVAAIATGGLGGLTGGTVSKLGTNPYVQSGNGGDAGDPSYSTSSNQQAGAQAIVNGAQITVSGNGIAGVVAMTQGGAGASGNYFVSGGVAEGANGGNGGNGGRAFDVYAALDAAIISTSGAGAPGLMAVSQGGAGGVGATLINGLSGGDAGNGGAGGASGTVTVSLTGGSITTSGAQSAAILALSMDGSGGEGGYRSGGSGDAGGGGAAGCQAGSCTSDVIVTVVGTSVSTSGAYAPGLVAASVGGEGGNGNKDDVNDTGSPRTGGAGGTSGLVSVSIETGTSITTTGDESPAVVAMSVGGKGGAGTDQSNVVSSNGGDGGAGGNAGIWRYSNFVGHSTVIGGGVENQGTLTTSGKGSFGIVLQSVSGGGGAGGSAGALAANAGAGGSAGEAGIVTLLNGKNGKIVTGGAQAHGILVQSIGGNGGNGGDLDFANSGDGGNAGTAANGNVVMVGNEGLVKTTGRGAYGILAQSVGGGGGNAGDAEGVVTIGGQGGSGGNGGPADDVAAVGLCLGAGSRPDVCGASDWEIWTRGTRAPGVVAQSVGGGGGNGGDAIGSVGLPATVSIGGTAGNGGEGKEVVVVAAGGQIITEGSKSPGITAQSVGGGGGSAGAAYSPSSFAGVDVAVAVGGTGGLGGNGGNVKVILTDTQIATGASRDLDGSHAYVPTNLLPVDSYGVLAQSVGGGGGLGGPASAEALAVAVPVSEDKQAGLGVAVAVGGNGGAPGNGGTVTLTLNGTATITTQGMGGHGVLAQSIGGGGGAGGDSSALAAVVGYNRAASTTEASVYEISAAVGQGGAASNGGTGGPVYVDLGGEGGSPQITTYGDFADGVVAQSVGGGGGDAGIGASTSLTLGGARTLSSSVALGGQGGSGGAGGTASVTVGASANIETYGDGAHAIVAQSIGGGGGTSQGGTVTAGATYQQGIEGTDTSIQPGATTTVNMGSAGGNGGGGAAVTVNMAGTITTRGNDSSGVLAQSIGGGGGVGGTSGSDASADNPILPYTKARAVISNSIYQNEPTSVSATVNLGASSQSLGGNGGTVTVTQSGTITTEGDWSNGLLAQSIGGGGGKAGSALGTGPNSAAIQVSLNVAVGQRSSGNGNEIDLQLNNARITTGILNNTGLSSGYAAFGIVAQSIGGGGGFASDGSDAANGTVLSTPGSALVNSRISVGDPSFAIGGSGYGGPVNLNGAAAVTTYGDAAHAILLQSIGGGGGIAGAGSSRFTGDALGNGNITLTVGGGGTATGEGGNVTVGQSATTLNLITYGTNAYGLLVQSIGGGGGLGFTQPGVPTSVAALGNSNPYGGQSGGNINITLKDSTITTYGTASHGIVLQSIGGGGGIAGYAVGASGTPTLSVEPPTSYAASGDGGPITLTFDGTIITQGNGAFGILAQSIGSGGGLQADSALGTLYAGSTGTQGGGYADTVTIVQSGSIATNGVNSVGIFVQSATQGCSSCTGAVSVTVNGSVSGGSGPQGAGIWIDSGLHNVLQVSSSGSVSALSGTAITYTGAQGVSVNNLGTVSGSYSLGAVGAFTNNGTLNTGATQDAVLLVNHGILNIGMPGELRRTVVTGDFVQNGSGRLVVDADFTARIIDHLSVNENAALGGQLQVLSSNLLPYRALTFLDVAGTPAGALDSVPANMFNFPVTQTGGSYAVSVTADFNQPDFRLSASQARAAEHLQGIWNAGGGTLGPIFGALANISLSSYPGVLSNMVSEALNAPGAESISLGQQHMDRLMSCPIFEGATAIVTQTSCVWAVGSGQHFDQGAFGDASGYTDTVYSYAMGMQKEVAQSWFFGIAAGYDDSLISGNAISVAGSSGWIGATLKHELGPLLFAAAATGSFGTVDSNRTTFIGSIGGLAQGSSALAGFGGRLRAAYTVADGLFYARPYVDLDLLYTSLSGYSETGAGLLDRKVSGNSQWAALATPAVEFGTRLDLPGGGVLRGYVRSGVTFSSLDNWSSTVSLVAAPAGVDGFSAVLPMDDVYARIGAGLDLAGFKNGLALRAEYEGAFSEHTSRNMGSLRLSIDF